MNTGLLIASLRQRLTAMIVQGLPGLQYPPVAMWGPSASWTDWTLDPMAIVDSPISQSKKPLLQSYIYVLLLVFLDGTLTSVSPQDCIYVGLQLFLWTFLQRNPEATGAWGRSSPEFKPSCKSEVLFFTGQVPQPHSEMLTAHNTVNNSNQHTACSVSIWQGATS